MIFDKRTTLVTLFKINLRHVIVRIDCAEVGRFSRTLVIESCD